MAQLFKEEEGYPDNAQRKNLLFMGYPFTPPLHRDDYARVVAELQQELPVRLWYFLDEVTTSELMRKVWRAILRSDLSVFDISGGNPNVAFELGLAVAKDRRCITILKTGESNPLGSADLGYAERIEYDSAISLKNQLGGLIRARCSGVRMISELSYTIAPNDGSISREAVESRLLAVVTKVFNAKSIRMSGIKTLMKTDALATAAVNVLRSQNILKIEGERGGARYVFTDEWVHHDHEVTGDL